MRLYNSIIDLSLYANKVIESEGYFMSDYVIETKQLTKVYGDQTAVNAVDLHVKSGQIYGLQVYHTYT